MKLDLECARFAEESINSWKTVVAPSSGNKENKKTAEDLENAANKGLGILIENGPYAFFLWLDAEAGADEGGTDAKNNANANVRTHANRLLDKCMGECQNGNAEALQGRDRIVKESEDLDRVLLIKRLLERYLTYVRYGARAMRKTEKAKKSTGVEA